jgi:hypothetical protein
MGGSKWIWRALAPSRFWPGQRERVATEGIESREPVNACAHDPQQSLGAGARPSVTDAVIHYEHKGDRDLRCGKVTPAAKTS